MSALDRPGFEPGTSLLPQGWIPVRCLPEQTSRNNLNRGVGIYTMSVGFRRTIDYTNSPIFLWVSLLLFRFNGPTHRLFRFGGLIYRLSSFPVAEWPPASPVGVAEALLAGVTAATRSARPSTHRI